MSHRLFAHPFSSYCWKAMIAFHEKAVPYALVMLDDDHPDNVAEFGRRWPLRRMPLLVTGAVQVMEATSIIEWLDREYRDPPLIPDAAALAQAVRMLDRVFDNYVMAPMMVPVFDALRPAAIRDAHGVTQARELAQTAYAWLDTHMRGREWSASADFSMADCAAAPALFYADWVTPIPEVLTALHAYRARLLARPSVARCVEAARPYRAGFPLGAPDRD